MKVFVTDDSGVAVLENGKAINFTIDWDYTTRSWKIDVDTDDEAYEEGVEDAILESDEVIAAVDEMEIESSAFAHDPYAYHGVIINDF